MTIPLILQIQEAALDSKSSVTDGLRKAKIACAKLGLTEFGNWVDRELNGYINVAVRALPSYRRLYGTPEAYTRYQGWIPINFALANQQEILSFAPLSMAISLIEESVPKGELSGLFSFPYPIEIQSQLRKSMPGIDDLRIRLETPQVASILHAVRDILLDWTIDMEKQQILGENLTFSQAEREKSASVTAQTVNNITIAQVGSFVQSAQQSVVQGGVDATMTLSEDVRRFVQETEELLPASGLPSTVQENTRAALSELREAANRTSPDGGRLRKGLETLKKVLAPAGEHA